MTELRDIDAGASAKNDRVLGITSMDYSRYYGGFLLTTAYTQYINVWSPDASLSKSFSGRLEGHSGIVSSCRIFHRSSQCISLDQLGDIKIWDLRNFICIQSIRIDGCFLIT